ncbi:hypothetical protein MNBD_BACTEROID03-548 [hydrothermal vent metagenome]|uniref:Uncharacterized protein n=1 Tax=hydrothermal vent metagenome TaxID=652676 RepID=A0A3B0T2Y5_9ZZZZ
MKKRININEEQPNYFNNNHKKNIMRTKNTKFFVVSCCVALTVLFSGCSKDSPLNVLGGCGTGNWVQQAESDLTNWNAAVTDYANDPTPANCAKYKSAGKNYIDVLSSFASCVPGADKNEFNEAVKEAKKELDESECGS